MKPFEALSVRCRAGQLEVLDQRLLPDKEEWLVCDSPDDMIEYIKQLSVRGAPLIGICAAYALASYHEKGASREAFAQAAENLRSSRPTAVNLMFALDRLLATKNPSDEAEALFHEERARNEAMSKHGASLIQKGEGILTHCNTGGLATIGLGTAIGVITLAHQQDKNIHVYVDETRPLLQGGRLTTWELERLGIPYTLICDNMAAMLMQKGKIHRVLVGADRIAMNGDFANKIGTYSAAVLAHYHRIPFHSVAPVSTLDWTCPTGDQIPIEHRKVEEVHGVNGSFGSVRWSPASANVYNPAFDVTPVELVESLILDEGIITQKELQNGELTHVGSHRRIGI